MLRQAAQEWIRVGIEQYQRDLFEAARQSFRRARVYRKYLTDDERPAHQSRTACRKGQRQ
jgi:hypothetical protein